MKRIEKEEFVALGLKVAQDMAVESTLPLALIHELLMIEAEPVFGHFMQRVEFEIFKPDPLNVN